MNPECSPIECFGFAKNFWIAVVLALLTGYMFWCHGRNPDWDGLPHIIYAYIGALCGLSSPIFVAGAAWAVIHNWPVAWCIAFLWLVSGLIGCMLLDSTGYERWNDARN